jgi:flagellar P-ring protein FlgI
MNTCFQRHVLSLLLISLCSFFAPFTPSHASRLKDLVSIEGMRSNPLLGYGLVVGLDGTGDQTAQVPTASQSVVNMLNKLGIQVPPGTLLSLKNVAIVLVTAELPAFVQPGQQIDVTVSSLYNAKSLKGGTLVMTPLKGSDGQIYAQSQGSVLIGGGGGRGAPSSLNAGRIPNGATVERAVVANVGEGGFIHLSLHDPDFTTARRMVDAINKQLKNVTAEAIDARRIRVKAPIDVNQRVSFLSGLDAIEVQPDTPMPKVTVNARTGSVVMNQQVTIGACAVSHGNLSVSIGANGAPLPLTASPETPREKSALINIPKATSLNEVVRALTRLGAAPQDLIAILQAMKSVGALNAELEVI